MRLVAFEAHVAGRTSSALHPHSRHGGCVVLSCRRGHAGIQVKLTIQKEVLNGTILQQTFVAEYVVEWHMCDACAKMAANSDQWVACCQV